MAAQSLAALEQRLGRLSHSPSLVGTAIKIEDIDINLARGKYICGECAFTTSHPSGLGSHFLSKHISESDRSFVCPHHGCESRFFTESKLKEHGQRAHQLRLHCGHSGCHYTFVDGPSLAHHEKQHTQRDQSFQSRTCPDSECGQVFPDQASLFVHYHGNHPLSIFTPDKKNPYKCPFCGKTYSSERYMPGHQRRDHSTNEGPSDGSSHSQVALIRQSHESMARRAPQMTENSMIAAEPAAREEKHPLEELGGQKITINGDRVYMHGDDQSLRVPQSDVRIKQEHQALREAPIIGHQLPTAQDDTTALKTKGYDDEDEYPESFALEEWELPQNNGKGQIRSHDHLRRIIRWILILLDLDGWLEVSEVLDVWDTFLSPDQRSIILQQFQDIDVSNDDSVILSALHGSVLCEVIHAWAQFKLLALQIPAEMREDMSSARGTTLAILRYCQSFEALLNEARPVVSAHCIQLADLLRPAPADASITAPDAPFIELLSALEARVKCRTVHPIWLRLTNEMVLKEMRCYIHDLKTEAKAVYSLSLRTDNWYHRMGII